MMRSVGLPMATVVLAAALITGVAAEISRAGEPEARNGLLAALPSAPGAHLAKIKALGDGGWLALGAPRPDPKWGAPPGRAYSPKMAFAPDLRGAFLYGEGAHGTFRKDGYVQDGLWFYDMNAHAWICCYPGTKAANAGLKLNAENRWQDRDGRAVPVTVMHGFDQIAYDPDRKLFAAAVRGSYYSMPKIKGLDYGGKDPKKLGRTDALWHWDPRTATWRVHRGKAPMIGYANSLLYLPGLGKLWLWNGRESVHLYDCEKKSWQTLKPAGPRPPFVCGAHSAYDPERDRVYLGGGDHCKSNESLWIYDVKKNTWTNAKAAGSPLASWQSNGSTAAAFDTQAGLLLVFHFGSRKLHVYDPKTNSWSSSDVDRKVDTGHRGYRRWNIFHDPETNAHYLHAAGDSRTDGVVWVYRHRRAGARRGGNASQ